MAYDAALIEAEDDAVSVEASAGVEIPNSITSPTSMLSPGATARKACWSLSFATRPAGLAASD